MKLVKVDSKYTDYLRSFDNRISFNKDKTYERPYIGILFRIKNNLLYFAPLTSSRKGNKLKSNPKKESITFYPICNCKLGGINFNNMIPLIEGVYKEIIFINVKNVHLRNLYYDQFKILNKKEKYLKIKAKKLYSLKINNKLYKNYDSVTCDFKLLEDKATEYKK